MSNQPDQSSSPNPETPNPAPGGGTPPAGGKSDKKLVSGLLAILLGWTGAHKFYLGYQKEGIITLVISLVTCGSIGSIIGIVEGVIYLTKTDEEFETTYVKGSKPWF